MTVCKNLSHYDILGLPRTATLAEIRKAYRQNALRHHPDKDNAENATALFQRIVEAYEVLSSVRTRLLYDAEQRNFVSNEAERIRVAEEQEKDHAIARDRLIQACKSRDSWQAMKLLRGGFANLNAWDQHGRTPLIYAAGSQATQVVSILILYQADVNTTSSDGWTPIMFAINEGDRVTDDNQASCLEGLLKAQADPNIRSKADMTALQLACAHNNLVAVQSLLTHAANPDMAGDNGMTPLALAAEGGHYAIARALLDAAAGVDITDHDGKTPLMHASALACESVVSLLLEAKADARATSVDGSTAFSLTTDYLNDSCLNQDQRSHARDITLLLIAARADPCSLEGTGKILDLAETLSCEDEHSLKAKAHAP